MTHFTRLQKEDRLVQLQKMYDCYPGPMTGEYVGFGGEQKDVKSVPIAEAYSLWTDFRPVQDYHYEDCAADMVIAASTGFAWRILNVRPTTTAGVALQEALLAKMLNG